MTTCLSGIWETEAVGIGTITCVLVAVMVGWGSGTVRMSGVTWLAVVLVVGGGPPVGSGLLDVRVGSLGKVAEGLPWGVPLPDGTIVSAPVVVIALAAGSVLVLSVEGGVGIVLPDGTVVSALVVAIALAVSVLLLSVEGGLIVVLPDGTVVSAPVVGIALAAGVLLLFVEGVFPPVGVMPLGPVDVVGIVGVLIGTTVVGSDSDIVGVVGVVVGGGADDIVGVVGVEGVESGVVGGGTDGIMGVVGIEGGVVGGGADGGASGVVVGIEGGVVGGAGGGAPGGVVGIEGGVVGGGAGGGASGGVVGIEGGVVGGGAGGGAPGGVVSCASAVSVRVRRTVVRHVNEVNFMMGRFVLQVDVRWEIGSLPSLLS